MNAVEMFYTENGYRPEYDKNFVAKEDWLKSAGLERPEVVNLHVRREPRFYAWINFDGGDMGPKLGAGKPKKLNLRSSARDTKDPNTI